MEAQEALIASQGRQAPSAAGLEAIEQIAYLSEVCRVAGVSDAELLGAIGKRRDTFDGLAVFCSVNSALMKLLTPWGLVLLEGAALIALVSKIIEYGDDVVAYVREKFGPILTIVSALAGIGGIGYLAYKWFFDSTKKDASIMSLSAAAFKGFIIGMFPGPIQGALTLVAVELGGPLGVGTGGDVARDGAPDHLPGPSEGDYDADTIQAVADAFGVPVNEVMDAIES